MGISEDKTRRLWECDGRDWMWPKAESIDIDPPKYRCTVYTALYSGVRFIICTLY